MSHRSLETATYPKPLAFSDENDVDVFIDKLAKFERGEIDAAEWRAFRLVNGAYGQRQEGDLSMLRAKIPQGIVNAEQLDAVADVADKWSRGFAHVTTRQNFQLHFIPLASMGDAMRYLAQVGITTREACGNSVRNVTCGHTAGVAEDELFDVTPYAEALTRFLLRHPLSSTLPRKFKIAFAAGGTDHAFAAVNDIGFHARIQDGKRGFHVTVAGGTAVLLRSGQVLFDYLPAARIFEMAESVIRVFDRLGDRIHRHKNRMKFLVKQIGWETFRDEVHGELEKLSVPFPFDPENPPVVEAAPTSHAAAPALDDLRALAVTTTSGPGLHPRALPLAADSARWRKSNVRPQKQAGFSMVTITLPLGDLTSGQLRAVAKLTAAYGDGTLRLTPSQNFVLRWVKNDFIAPLYEGLGAIALNAPDAYSLADVVSCPGAESCKLAVTQSRGLARMLSDHFAGKDLPELPVHVSGCPNGCGLHHVAGIGFQGGLKKIDGRALPQYFVYAGGEVGEGASFGRVVAKVLARRVPEATERLLALAKEHGTPGETVASTLRRLDTKVVKSRLADLESTPPTPDDFIDLGETEAFTDGTSEGECAA